MNLLYSKALEFGEHWLRPLIEWAQELWSDWDRERQIEISEYVKTVRSEINEYIASQYNYKIGALSVPDENVKKWIKQNYPWMTEENIIRGFSQGMYYAWRG